MAEEIGELDLTAQANAAQTATDYVTSIGSTGIHIHPKNDIGLNYQKLTSEGIDIVADGWSVAKMGTESVSENNGTRKIGVVRVGNEAHGHIILNEGGMRYNQADQTMFAVEPVGDPVYTIAHTYASVTVEPYSSTGRAASFTSSGKVDVDYPLDYVVLWSADGGTTWKEALEQVGEMSTLSNNEVYFYTPAGIYGGSVDRTTATIDHRILNMTSSTITAAIAKVVDARTVRTIIGKPYDADGADNQSHVETDYHSLQLVDREGNAYLYVSDLRGPDGSMLVEWESELTYVQALSTASMDLLLPPTTYQTSIITENIVSVVAHTPSGDVDITNYVNASSSSASELVFTSLPTLGTFTRATATATYHTSDRRVKALTYGSRKTPEDIGACSSVLGWENDASGLFSHAHGNGCVASGVASNAEGGETEAVADYSHAEGRSSGTGKYAYCGHAEGCNTHANAHSAHSEGYRTTASGEHAHAEGYDAEAIGDNSHAQNHDTIAASDNQTAIGKYNVEDTNDTYALIVGNGTADGARSNAATIDWGGNYLGQAMAGIIQMFAGATPPNGWLVCDGSAVSRTTYATLFAAIGTTWGTGDGSTTFNLPDLRGRAPIGAGTGSGLTARTLGTQNIGSENVQEHTHSISRTTNVAVSDSGHTHPAATSNYYYAIGSATFAKQDGHAQSGSSGLTNAVRQSGTVSSNKNTGSGKANLSVTQPVFSVGAVSGATTGTEGNMQPSAVVNFIICTGKTS